MNRQLDIAMRQMQTSYAKIISEISRSKFCSIMQASRLRSTGLRLLCGVKFGVQQFRGFAQQDPGEYPVEPEPPVPSTVL